MNTPALHAAIYARKPTEQNGVVEANKSVTRQKELARAFALSRGWSVVAEFEDDGISGAEFERRPGFQAMLKAARRGDFQYLVVSEQKSLGRESYETQHTIKRLAQAGSEIWAYMDGRSLTSRTWIDKAVTAVRSWADEAHRADTALRTHEAHRQKMLAGSRSVPKRYAVNRASTVEFPIFYGCGQQKCFVVQHAVANAGQLSGKKHSTFRRFGTAIFLLHPGEAPQARPSIMGIDDVRAAVEQHICVVAGVPYQFRLEWCATEKYVEPVSARNLLNIECIANANSAEGCVPLYVVVWLTDLRALPAILQDALHTQLGHHRVAECDSGSANPGVPFKAINSTSRVH
jgi:DNA invertase Pin-like site-specific DNA recombinase